MTESTKKQRTVFRTCPLCEATCGLSITLDGDRVVSTRGDEDDVFSRGYICPKGVTLGDLQHDPDRLRRPAVRDGDTWRDVDWPEAFARVHAGLATVRDAGGRDAIGIYLGNPNVHNLAGMIYARALVKALGTKNVFTASTVDQMPKHVASGSMFGSARTIAVPDLDRTDYLLMLGANPLASNGSLCTAPDFPGRLRALKKRGGKLVVVDPRRSLTAKKADEHVFIRPGGDALLLFAIVHVLFETDRIRLRDAAAHVVGVDAVRAHAAAFAPEVVAAACGVDAATIRRLADELAHADRAVVYGRMGTSVVAFGTLANWLVDVINTLTGNLDRAGGAMFPRGAHSRHRPGRTPGGRGFASGRWRSRVRDYPEVLGEFPAATMADEILTEGEGRVRALITVAGNPALSTPNGARLDDALGSLDFMVSVDLYRNETSRHADVILPPPAPLERPHFDMAFADLAVRNVANFSPAALALPDGARAEEEILLQLALIAAGQGPQADPHALDEMIVAKLVHDEVTAERSTLHGRNVGDILGALAPRKGSARIIDFLVRAGPYGDGFGATDDGLTLDALLAHPHGIDFGALESRLPEILTTASGKVELCPDGIAADIPRLAASIAAPVDALTLVGRRDLRSNNSWMHNIDRLVRGPDRCTLWVHPDDARSHGLTDGDAATIASRAGSLTVAVEVTDAIMAGVVSLPHGWGHDQPGAALSVAAQRPGVNSNRLTDETVVDPLSGNAVLNGIPVTLAAVPR